VIAPQISDRKWNGRQAEEERGGSLGRSPLNKWRTEQVLGRCFWKRIKDQVKKRKNHHGAQRGTSRESKTPLELVDGRSIGSLAAR
jgi:hypothetical protein